MSTKDNEGKKVKSSLWGCISWIVLIVVMAFAGVIGKDLSSKISRSNQSKTSNSETNSNQILSVSDSLYLTNWTKFKKQNISFLTPKKLDKIETELNIKDDALLSYEYYILKDTSCPVVLILLCSKTKYTTYNFDIGLTESIKRSANLLANDFQYQFTLSSMSNNPNLKSKFEEGFFYKNDNKIYTKASCYFKNGTINTLICFYDKNNNISNLTAEKIFKSLPD